MRNLPLASVTLAVAFASASFAQADDFQAKAAAAFQPVVKQYDIPGLIVGITRNGTHEFYATGLASRADRREVTSETLFELGSISKLFNVTLAALAEQRGKLKLEDKVAHHLCADTCRIGDDLTLMDLATHHTGGMPLQVPDSVSDVNGLVDWMKDWKPANPGARSYSNVSIGMLGHISAKAMGMPYAKAAEGTLFPALGLKNTFITVPQSQMKLYAYGYNKANQPIRVGKGLADAEAYGVKSSASDMLTFLDAELGTGSISGELQKAIARTKTGQLQTAYFSQAMVWEEYPWPVKLDQMVAGNSPDFILKPQPVEKLTTPAKQGEGVILNKTGSTNGFGGYVAILPEKKLGIVVLANRNYPNEARIRATYALIKSLGE
ncbi:class C beta-lactamase [Rhizobium sp. FKY42]|uniref:class C beta-lactamase n=1 Tax=Rhizobium sp. FKY42 TaxID=2562310 RepID=UPI0010C0E530|nr:class C beta-lactamase [Rhizobium sp. FKY42]